MLSPRKKSSAAERSIASPHGALRRRGLVQIHMAAFLVGFPGLFTKWLELSPAMITCGRLIVGAMALWIYAWISGASLRIPSRRALGVLVLSGGTLALHWTAFFKSIEVSTVAIGMLSFSTFPLFVTFLEPLFFPEKLHGSDIVTAVVVIAGLAIIPPRLDLHDHLMRGVLWGVLCALGCAVFSLLSRGSVRAQDPVAVAFYQQAFGAVFSLPALCTLTAVPSGKTLGLLLLLGTVFTAGAQALIVSSLRHIRAQVASVVIALEPVYGILFAVILLGEIPTGRTLLGGGLICGAVFWASWKHRPEPVAGHG
jgi:drug/metabolite transporter (DMT)-like permease